jgi:hypothetical protein
MKEYRVTNTERQRKFCAEGRLDKLERHLRRVRRSNFIQQNVERVNHQHVQIDRNTVETINQVG